MTNHDEEYDLVSLDHMATSVYGAQVPGPHALRVHPASACANDEACVIHKPSDHPMREFPLNWRGDRGLMERICPHGVGHPDPDDISYKRRTLGDEAADAEAVHGCDGCCRSLSEQEGTP